MELGDVEGAARGLGVSAILAYICGPLPLIQFAEGSLERLGVPSDRIRYEKWQ